jgi:hypothetical protein
MRFEVEEFRVINVIARKVLSDEAISDRQNKGIASFLAMTCWFNCSWPSRPAGSKHLVFNVIARKVLSDEAISEGLNKGIASFLAMT